MKFEIAPKETEIQANWDDAKLYCFSLNTNNKTGWRLPTIEELLFLRNQEDNDLRWDFYYWSSIEFDCDHALVVYYENCTQLNKICSTDGTGDPILVRPVRSL